jgi:hypothetical protein
MAHIIDLTSNLNLRTAAYQNFISPHLLTIPGRTRVEQAQHILDDVFEATCLFRRCGGKFLNTADTSLYDLLLSDPFFRWLDRLKYGTGRKRLANEAQLDRLQVVDAYLRYNGFNYQPIPLFARR